MAPYIKDDARVQVWMAGFSTCLSGITQLSQDQTFGSRPLVMNVSGVTP